MLADKLHASSKIMKAAKKARALAEAKPMKAPALRRFAIDEAKRRGHTLPARAADALVEACGDDLAALDDALERLSLYVGDSQRIDGDAVRACVSRVAVDSIWALVDSVATRDAERALTAAGSLLADREAPIRILAMVTRQLRIVARMREALASGMRGAEAATTAGAPPFKARQLTEAARRFTARQLRQAFETLADADLALKGSRVPDDIVLEEAVLRLCVGAPRARPPVQRRLRSYR